MGDDLFSLELVAKGDVQVFALRGELDVAHSEDVQHALMAATRSIVVDLSELTFIDSSGLTALLHAHDEITGRGGSFVVRGAKGSVRRVFEITGLWQFFA
jgi:anti-anti-sigma factor